MAHKDVYVTIRGNATKDAHRCRNDKDPGSVVVRIAVTRRFFDEAIKDFRDVKSTDYYNVYGSGALGRNMLESVRKGDPVMVTGRLSYSEWTRDDGTEGHSMSIRADGIGHDLTFGTSRMQRSSRAEEAPGIDRDSGEIIDEAVSILGSPSGPDDAGDAVDANPGGDGDVDEEETKELAAQGSGIAPF